MFGFLIKNEVNDDAVRLKTVVDDLVARYGDLPTADRPAALQRDLVDKVHVDEHNVTFQVSRLDYFTFTYALSATPMDPDTIMVTGLGKYAGFMMFASPRSAHCEASDGILKRSTAGATKLARTLDKKFGISDLTAEMQRYR